MPKTTVFIRGALCALALAFAAPAWALPNAFIQEGLVLDGQDAPIEGNHRIVARLFAAADGGAPLFEELHPVVPFFQGYYAIAIGSEERLDASLFTRDTLWLEIQIDNRAPLAPRTAINKVPAAFVADLARDVIGPINPTSVTVDGNLIIDQEGRWVGDPTGLRGPAGPQGQQGPAGPQGAVGPQGPVGPRGPRGASGDSGNDGQDGQNGRDGEDGADADPNVAADIVVARFRNDPGLLPFVRDDADDQKAGSLTMPNGNLTLSQGRIIFGDGNARNALQMNNHNITGANRIDFNDPGPNEGVRWSGSQAKIVVSPLNDANRDGYLRLINDDGISLESDVLATADVSIAGGLEVAEAAIAAAIETTTLTATNARLQNLNGVTRVNGDLDLRANVRLNNARLQGTLRTGAIQSGGNIDASGTITAGGNLISGDDGKVEAGGQGIWVNDTQVFNGDGRLMVPPQYACGANQVLIGVGANGRAICRSVNCPAGTAFRGWNGNGDPRCERDDSGLAAIPANRCAAGQALIEIGANGATVCGNPRAGDQRCPDGELVIGHRGNGSVICAPDNAGIPGVPANECGAGQAIVGIAANGATVCGRPRAGNQSCPAGQYVAGLNANGSVVCRADASGIAAIPGNRCGGGQAIFRIHPDGRTECRTLHSGNRDCPDGEKVTGVNSDGSIECAPDNAGLTAIPARSCGAGQAIYRIRADGRTECRQLHAGAGSCPAGQVVREVQANGTIICIADNRGLAAVPANTCGAGQAIYRIHADGRTECRALHSGDRPCPNGQVVRRIRADGRVDCVAANNGLTAVPANTCGAGQAIVRINANGSTVCGNPRAGNRSCPDGQFMTGLAANGAVVCSAPEPPGPGDRVFNSCKDGLAQGFRASGLFRVRENGGNTVREVWCDQETDGGGWTLVASTRNSTLNDQASGYYNDLRTLAPSRGNAGVWNGLRAFGGNFDVRFACRDAVRSAESAMTVDLSFYNVPWYMEFTSGSDANSCFSERNGAGDENPPPERRNNLNGQRRARGDQWNAGYLEGEDSCGDTGDFTVDFDDRGMDNNQSDGTDWGEDDSSRKCGRSGLGGGQWFIYARERNAEPNASYRSCKAAREAGQRSSGVYNIQPPGQNQAYQVWCDMTTDGGGWTLVASTRNTTLNDQASGYYNDLRTLAPAAGHDGIWNGMRGFGGNADVRFACRDAVRGANDAMTVDLSFYNVNWYREWTTGSDANSCFEESNGRGDTQPEPSRRNNRNGQVRGVNDPWNAGYLEGEDSCGDTGDFTVDFDDRGMDSNQSDGTDWGEDDSSRKCGRSGRGSGQWFIYFRER